MQPMPPKPGRTAPLALAALLAVASAVAAAPVAYTVVDGTEIPEPLVDAPGDPDRGGVVYLDPERGRCNACHSAADAPGPKGDAALAGPGLDGVAERFSEGELRLILVNPRSRWPQSTMPAYFNVSAELAESHPDARQPVLTAREVEDVLAFLLTLGAE